MKVKKEAMSALGLFHVHLGPAFQSVVIAAAGKDESRRSLLQKTFEEHPFDPSCAEAQWPKQFISVGCTGEAEGGGATSASGLQLDVPTMDLFAEIPDDCIQRMVSAANLFTRLSTLDGS